MDVTVVITFEQLFQNLKNEIDKSVGNHCEFWSHLESSVPDHNYLHKMGLVIINNTKKINDLWHQLQKINSRYPKALQLYGDYLYQIKNDEAEGKELMD